MSQVCFSIPISKPDPGRRVAVALQSVLSSLKPGPTSAPTVLCVGSDRATGDSLGPLVGSMLVERLSGMVFCTFEQPVHAANLNKPHAPRPLHHNPGRRRMPGTKKEVGTIIVKGPPRPDLA